MAVAAAAAASTHVAADNGRITMRPQRSKAGNRLHTILQAVREECEEGVETSPTPTRAHHADLKDKQSRDNEHDAEPGCCVCEQVVAKDTEPFLTCSQEECQAVVHVSCTSYTVRGAKPAKFQCPTCRANKLLAHKKRDAGNVKAKDKPKEAASTCTPHPRSPCPCMSDDSCSNCVSEVLACNSNSNNKETPSNCSSPVCLCTNGGSCSKCMSTSTLPSLAANAEAEAQPLDTQACKSQPSQTLLGSDVLSAEQVLPACLCSGEQVCDRCLHPTQLAAVVCSVEKENQALKLHILALEECVKALENVVLASKDNGIIQLAQGDIANPRQITSHLLI